MVERISNWKPNTLATAYFWCDRAAIILASIILLIIIMPGLAMFAAGMSHNVLPVMISVKLQAGISMFSYSILGYALAALTLYGFKKVLQRAINLSILKDATVSVFKGPFGFKLTKFYLSESSEWRKVVEPSPAARKVRQLSQKKNYKIGFNSDDQRQVMDYWHSPFVFKNGMTFDPTLSMDILKYLATKGSTLQETDDLKGKEK